MSRVRMSDLAKLGREDVQGRLREARGELAKMRVLARKSTFKKDSGKLRPLRRDIARMETRLSEIKLEEFMQSVRQNAGATK